MSTVPELAVGLAALVPEERIVGDWADVVRRAGVRRRRPSRRPALALVAAAVCLLLAGVATATYVLLHRSSPAQPKPGPGALTVLDPSYSSARLSGIDEILPGGKRQLVWQCPAPQWCGVLTSLDWSPDGSKLAFTLDETGGRSTYVGLHILDLTTRRDIHLGARDAADLGCMYPSQLAWSPDSRTLAYSCTSIHLIRSDGTGSRRLNTRTPNASWPTWSPDGKRLAFAALGPSRHSSVYVIDRDGRHRRLIAAHASIPDWSVTGVLAVATPKGIKLISDTGRQLRTRPLGPYGAPAWSPDGRMLAVTTRNGLYVVSRSGANRHYVSSLGGPGAYGAARPAWFPGKSRTELCGDC